MNRRGKTAGWLACALLSLLLAGPAEARKAPRIPLIAAAGDIACASSNPRYNNGVGTDDSCQQFQTSNLLLGRDLSAVLPLGDLQYDENGSLGSYAAGYEPSWGRLRAASHPVIGNHEYDDGLGAQGYWDYWNGVGAADGPAGVRGQGWYSYNLGSWHLVALNSNCDFVSCRGDSRQLRWLRRDLRDNADRCTLAYMHHPRFSSGIYEELGDTRALWIALYRGGADVVLNGHDHIYERFARSRPDGVIDPKRGITQFTVGTGGYFLFSTLEPHVINSRFAYNGGFGVIFMRLGKKRYGWNFENVAGATIDHGKRACHREKPRPKRHRRHHHDHHDGGGSHNRAVRSDAARRRSG